MGSRVDGKVRLDKLIVLATDLLQQVLGSDSLQNILLAGFLELTAQHQLVQDKVCLLEVEYYVQLAHLEVWKSNALHITNHKFQISSHWQQQHQCQALESREIIRQGWPLLNLGNIPILRKYFYFILQKNIRSISKKRDLLRRYWLCDEILAPPPPHQWRSVVFLKTPSSNHVVWEYSLTYSTIIYAIRNPFCTPE